MTSGVGVGCPNLSGGVVHPVGPVVTVPHNMKQLLVVVLVSAILLKEKHRAVGAGHFLVAI